MQLMQCLLETWQPKPTKTLVGEFPVEEGKTLVNNVIENVSCLEITQKISNQKLHKIRGSQSKYSEFVMMNTFSNGGSIQW